MALLGLWLDLMILKVFSNIKDSVIIKHYSFDYKTLVFLWCALIIFKNPKKTEQKSSPHNQHSLCLPLVPEAKSEHHIAKQ